MGRLLLGPGLLGGILLVFWLWALADVILTDSMLIRNMQKGTWVFLVVFLSTIGAAAWLLFGRPEGASLVPGGRGRYETNPYRTEEPGRYRPASGAFSPAPRGPEDTPGWRRPERNKPSLPNSDPPSTDPESLAIRERRLQEREAELAKREQALRGDEGDTAGGGDADGGTGRTDAAEGAEAAERQEPPDGDDDRRG